MKNFWQTIDVKCKMSQQYKIILEIISKNKALFALFFIVNIIQSAIAVLLPYFSKLQVDQLENRYGDFFSVFYSRPEIIFVIIILISVLINFFEKIFEIISNIQNKKIDYSSSIKIEKELYDRVEKFDIGFMQNPRNRRIVNNSIDLMYMVQRLLSFVSGQTRTIIAIFGILPIMAYFDLSVFLVVLLSGLIQILIIKNRTKKDMALNFIKERKLSRLWQLQDLIMYKLHNIANVGSENFVMKKYWDLRKKRYGLETETEKIYGKYYLLETLSQNFAYIFAALFAGFQVMNGSLSVGSFVMLVLYIGNLQLVFKDITYAIPDFNAISIQFHKLGFFMNLKPRLKLNLVKKIKDPIRGNIIFKKISFRYPNLYKEEGDYIKSIIKKEEQFQKKSSEVWNINDLNEWKEIVLKSRRKMPMVLNEIDCEFKKGEITAIVGRNGSGKTTIVNLITRNYDPRKGNISIGNHKLLNMEPRYLKKFISIIPQEPFILESFSVRDNIYFGEDNNKINKRIWDILEILNLKKDIEKLPKKLDSIIGDDVQFSGGQSQLLSIARILIQDRPIIIFDEGTSQLDAEHEAKIMDILKKIKKAKRL